MSNKILDFNKAKAARRSLNPVKLVSIEELTEDKVGLYKANVKSEIMIFLFNHVRDLSQEDAIKRLNVSEEEFRYLKNVRVSKFSIDRLFEIAFSAKFTFDMMPYYYGDDAKK